MKDLREALLEFRAEGLSEERRLAFRESAAITEKWDREHPLGLAGVLDFIDQLREMLGEPAVNTEPWRGDDFKI
jgi:hypothetical protein